MSNEPPVVGYVLKVFPRLSQTFIVNELRAHERAGVEVVIFSLKRPREADARLVAPPLRSQVVYLDGARSDWTDQLAREIEKRGIGHLHAHFGNVATTIAREAAAAAGIRYSFTAHAVDIFSHKVDPADLRTKIADAREVVTVSDFNVRHLEAHFGRRPRRIYNGLPLDDFLYRPEGRYPNSLLAVGRLVEKKGFETLVEACDLMAKREFPMDCVIVGDGPLSPRLEKMIDERGLCGRVEMLGALPPFEVRQHLLRATALVAPCEVAPDGDRDGLPTVLIEAMALGTPCISTGVTGIPELVLDGKTGVLVPPKEPERLAEACINLVSDPVFAARLQRAARRHVERRFDGDATASQLRSAWHRVGPRIVFRIHNRRGVGHWMRARNIAAELHDLAPDAEIVFFTRAAAPFAIEGSRALHIQADDPERMPLEQLLDMNLRPDLVVDDTMLPSDSLPPDVKHVFVMRKRKSESLEELTHDPRVGDLDCIIAPHEPEEMLDALPDRLIERTTFVGRIARGPTSAGIARVRRQYDLDPQSRLLVSTPGGGGFPSDFIRFKEVASRVHAKLIGSDWKHVFVCGPNAVELVKPVDARMIVVRSEAEMPSLFAQATAVLSAGGYNSVNEIRVARRPAFFLPGDRKFDDQHARVAEMVDRGFAWAFEGDDVERIASTIAGRLSDPEALERVADALQEDRFTLGNRSAAQAILDCLAQG